MHRELLFISVANFDLVTRVLNKEKILIIFQVIVFFL